MALSFAPLMFKAGFHARRDMAGKRDSVQSILDGMGFETECILNGMAEIEVLRELFLRPLSEQRSPSDPHHSVRFRGLRISSR